MLQTIGTFLAAPENFLWTALIFLALMGGFWLLFTFVPKLKPYRGQLLVITGLCLFTLLLFLCTYSFRVKKIMKYKKTGVHEYPVQQTGEENWEPYHGIEK